MASHICTTLHFTVSVHPKGLFTASSGRLPRPCMNMFFFFVKVIFCSGHTASYSYFVANGSMLYLQSGDHERFASSTSA